MESKKAVIAGGRRINQKKRQHGARLQSRHTVYLKGIESCNKKIDEMNDNDYIKFRDYSTKIVSEVCNEIKRDFFKDRDEFRKFKENRLKYLYTVLFYPKNSVKILFKTDNFNFIEKTFNKEGLVIIDKIVNTLESVIQEKKYEPVDEESVYNKEVFDNCCKELGIDSTEKVLFSKIKNAYNEKKEYAGGNAEEKDKINKAFIKLRNQYEDYLKNF